MLQEQPSLALAKFWPVPWALVVLIAGMAVLTGFVREHITGNCTLWSCQEMSLGGDT